ncbi:hypothetical protein SKAU_G00323730 [Synaphobranchus kaupii]|uniref:Uncharacterized protein n=1 Tax=Synaphobranchus kaupii TaxID=118154 RepID=A0A9Q1EPC2_SYNKA|nr:hypothetical protein SKAU_G00323730 [Synaphobranchus kaupii]
MPTPLAPLCPARRSRLNSDETGTDRSRLHAAMRQAEFSNFSRCQGNGLRMPQRRPLCCRCETGEIGCGLRGRYVRNNLLIVPCHNNEKHTNLRKDCAQPLDTNLPQGK